jgi:hypothetical protein
LTAEKSNGALFGAVGSERWTRSSFGGLDIGLAVDPDFAAKILYAAFARVFPERRD